MTGDNGQPFTAVTSPNNIGREEDDNVQGTSASVTYIDDAGQTDTVVSAVVTLGEPPLPIAADVILGAHAAWVALAVTVAARDSDDAPSSVTISGMPSGWSLSGDGAASVTGGTWTVGSGGLGGLVLAAPVTVGAAVVAPSFTPTTSGSGSAAGSIAPSGIGVTGDSLDASTLAPLVEIGRASCRERV